MKTHENLMVSIGNHRKVIYKGRVFHVYVGLQEDEVPIVVELTASLVRFCLERLRRNAAS